MCGGILERLTLVVVIASVALLQMGWAMDRVLYNHLGENEKAAIDRLENVSEKVRLGILAELFSVIPTDNTNAAIAPRLVSLPDHSQISFDEIVSEGFAKYDWSGLWHVIYDSNNNLMAVGRVYAKEIEKLRKLNGDKAYHAHDVVGRFRKVGSRTLDAFFMEMYGLAELSGSGVDNDCKVYGSDGRQYRWGHLSRLRDSKKWEDLKNLWNGNKGLLQMQFITQIAKLQRFNSKEYIEQQQKKKEREAEETNAAKVSAAAVAMVQNSLKTLPVPARMALLAALEEDVSMDELADASFTDAKGGLHYVYDDLQAAGAVEAALCLLQKVQGESSVREEVLTKNDAHFKGATKGAELRTLRAQALQKLFDARMAAREVEIIDRTEPQDPQHSLAAVGNLVQMEQNPLCRVVLMRIVTHKYTVQDLFSQIVYDFNACPHNCYDVLKEAGQLDTALLLMVDAHCCPALQNESSQLKLDMDDAQAKLERKRLARIQAALKAHEAAEAQRALQKAEGR